MAGWKPSDQPYRVVAAKQKIWALSAFCLLSWLFMFGLFSNTSEGTRGPPDIFIIAGTVAGVSPDGTLEIDNGVRTFSCKVGESFQLPAPGATVVVCCSIASDGSLIAIRAGVPWP